MQLTINVDETMFKDILEKELKAFSPEELHDIVKEMIKEYLKDSDVVKGLFVETRYNSYSSGKTNYPTDLLRQIVSKVDLTNQAEEVMNALTTEITQNSREIVSELFVKAITKSLTDRFYSEGSFNEIFMEMNRRLNNQ